MLKSTVIAVLLDCSYPISLFQPDPENDNQVLIPQTRFCESPHMWYFAGIIYAIKGRSGSSDVNQGIVVW